MVFDRKIQDAMNEQINEEFYSAYLYLSMSAFFEAQNLPGCAHWMRKQGEEEMGHAMKFFDFIHDRGGQVELKAVKQPPADFESPLKAFEMALEHERHISERIHNLYSLATAANDYASEVMLQWFIQEQVEEEKTASEIIQQLKRVGDNGSALLMIDARLGSRE